MYNSEVDHVQVGLYEDPIVIDRSFYLAGHRRNSSDSSILADFVSVSCLQEH